jgi:hypothetical protein
VADATKGRFRDLSGAKPRPETRKVRFFVEWSEDLPISTEFRAGDVIEVEGRKLTVWETTKPFAASVEGDLQVKVSDLGRPYHRERLEWASKGKAEG